MHKCHYKKFLHGKKKWKRKEKWAKVLEMHIFTLGS
jgi:hypothetical protein